MDESTDEPVEDVKPLLFGMQHARECHFRWLQYRNNLRPEDEGREEELPEEWYASQCGGCRYFVPLARQSKLGSDWGVCTSEASPLDGRVAFEHDGCDQYSDADGWVSNHLR